MAEPGANLELVISGLSAIQRTGSLHELAPILDESVFWQGLSWSSPVVAATRFWG